MKRITLYLFLLVFLTVTSCTSSKKLSYFQNLPVTNETQYFPYEIPDYQIQYRDILYVDVKALNNEGIIEDVLQGRNVQNQQIIQGESGQYLVGHSVMKDGCILLPVIGRVKVETKTLPEVRDIVQHKVDSVYNNAYVDVKLLSFKYTVLGEARSPGTYLNYNNYLTILEAIGRAGGVGDFGRRDRVLVIRPTESGSKTYWVNLQDKKLLTSEAYFLMPNDVVIIEPLKQKIFNLNLPTFAFTLTSITSVVSTTLLLINFLK